jgi:hypothetical protein
LIKHVRRFAAMEPNARHDDEDFIKAARDLRDLVRALSPDLPVMSGTLLLYLAGRFEHFVRMSFQNLCEGLASKCHSYAELPDKMRDNLRVFTAEVNLNPRKYGFDEVQAIGFMTTLVANVTSSTSLGPINSSCLSVTQNNMTPGMLAELFSRIGVGKLWSEMGKQAALKVHLSVTSDAEAEREAKARLEELMSLRNQIAHPSGTPSFPDPDQVIAYVGFVSVLASVLTDVSRVQLMAFRS